MTCSITIASRPLTTPAARVRTAPQVPALMVPNATSMSRSVSSPIEGTAHLFHLDAETAGDQVYRCLPGHFDETGRLEHRFEIQWATEAHPVHHHVGHRVMVVERDLAGRDACGCSSTGSSCSSAS